MKKPPRKNKIKICIFTAHPVFDDRIFHKEAKTLAKAGYDVAIIAQHDKQEVVDGVRIIPLPKPTNRYERMIKTNRKLFLLALKEKADLYHFHDPEIIPYGLVLKLLGKKVIYDVHEDYPKQILYKTWIANSVSRKIVSLIFGMVEKTAARIFDCTVAATPDIARKFAERKTITVRNMPVLGLIDKAEPLRRDKSKLIFLYAGGLSKIRGIKEVIKSMEMVSREEDNIELWLLGKWENEAFRNECEQLKGWKYTKYLGFVPLGKVYEYMKTADIGISTLYPIKNYLTSLPIKVYEYMACSLPIVMSDFPYWQEIFGQCAVFVDPYDPKDIAHKILLLLNDSEKAKELGRQGKRLVVEKYNWEAESQKLIDLYKGLLNGNKPS